MMYMPIEIVERFQRFDRYIYRKLYLHRSQEMLLHRFYISIGFDCHRNLTKTRQHLCQLQEPEK